MDNERVIKRIILIAFITVVCLAILTLPILLNSHFQAWRTVLNNEQPATWMGFIATFYGAIIGGIVSGALTLIGVRYTIKRERLKDMIEAYPKRRLLVDQLVDDLEYIHKWCSFHCGNENVTMLRKQLNDFVINDTLLEKASQVNDSVYERVRMTFNLDIKDVHEEIKENRFYNIRKFDYHLDSIKRTAEMVKEEGRKISMEYREIKLTY